MVGGALGGGRYREPIRNSAVTPRTVRGAAARQARPRRGPGARTPAPRADDAYGSKRSLPSSARIVSAISLTVSRTSSRQSTSTGEWM